MFSKEKILSFNDPKTEKWYTDIAQMVSNYTSRITNSEIKEATRLTAALMSLTTSIIPSLKSSNLCKNAIILKTLMIPMIEFSSYEVFKTRNGLLQARSSNSSNHVLLSKDSIISQSTTLFGQNIQVIGKSCEVSDSVKS